MIASVDEVIQSKGTEYAWTETQHEPVIVTVIGD
jgi:hypothetical protein